MRSQRPRGERSGVLYGPRRPPDADHTDPDHDYASPAQNDPKRDGRVLLTLRLREAGRRSAEHDDEERQDRDGHHEADLALAGETHLDERRPCQRDHGDREGYGEKAPSPPVSDPESVVVTPSVELVAIHHGKNAETTTIPEPMSASHEVAVSVKCCVLNCSLKDFRL